MSGSGLVCFRKPVGINTTAACRTMMKDLASKHRLPDDANYLWKSKKLKMGHIGTLDPNARGLCLALFGEATKIIQYLKVDPKRYIGVVQLGYETDSADIVGKIIAEGPKDWKKPDEEQMNSICSSFIGSILQKPPIYSATRIKGKKAYELARQGKITLDDMPLKQVEVYDFKHRFLNEEELEIDVTCGSGTFIRSIARDLSVAMGTKGNLKSLDRIHMGDYYLKPEEDYKLFSFNDLLDSISQPLYIPPGNDFGRGMLREITNGGKRLEHVLRSFKQLPSNRYTVYYQQSYLPQDIGNDGSNRPVALLEKNGRNWRYLRGFNFKEYW